MRVRQLIGLVALAAVAPAATAFGQGCAMCGSSFGQNDPTARAFSSSVLFLIAAPYTVFFTAAGVIFLLYRRGTSGRRATVLPLARRRFGPPTDSPKEVTP